MSRLDTEKSGIEESEPVGSPDGDSISNSSDDGFRVSTFASLAVPSFRTYYIVILGQMAAMNMQMVARSWFVYELTHNITLLGVLALANAVPMLFLSLFGGVLADNISKKKVLIAGHIASALVTMMVGFSIVFGSVTWVHLMAASFLQGVVMSLMMPARQAIIPELVGPRLITNAVTLNGAAMNLFRLIGPALAGFLIALWSIQGVYFVMSVLYMYGAFFLIKLPVSGGVSIKGTGVLSDIGEGVRYIYSNKAIYSLLIFTLMSFVFSMPYMFLLPAFTDTILMVEMGKTLSAEGIFLPSYISDGLIGFKLSAIGSVPLVGGFFETLSNSAARQGLLLSVSGIGALIGSYFIASMPDRNRGKWLLLNILLMAVSLVVFSITDSFFVALLIFIPLGLGQAGRMALSNSLAQAYSAPEYRGRVMSIYMLNWGMTSIGIFIVALIADVIGVQIAVGTTAALLILVTGYYMFFSKRIYNLD